MNSIYYQVKEQRRCSTWLKPKILHSGIQTADRGSVQCRRTSYPQLEHEYGVNRSTISRSVKQLSPIKVSEEETVTLKEYKALVHVPSNRQREYEEFGRKVKQAYDDSKQRYGAVKICRTLNDSGTSCSVKRVRRYMAEQGLRSVVVKKYKHHANHGSVPDDKENILKRDFEAETINQKWCTDITCIHVLK